jgi:hypothetical protein
MILLGLRLSRSVLFLLLWSALTFGTLALIGTAQSQEAANALDLDPLRRYVPRADIFMPVPGGVSALTRPADYENATIDEQSAQMHGGLIVGYCLKASCRNITHLVVLQVCNNQIGGPDGTDYLTLAVIRLPFGKKPGFLKSLQGRDYAYNFRDYGPYEQVLPIPDNTMNGADALYALSADGIGPIAPLQYSGDRPLPEQDRETLALHATMFQNDDGVPYPHFEVRHLCQQPVS